MYFLLHFLPVACGVTSVRLCLSIGYIKYVLVDLIHIYTQCANRGILFPMRLMYKRSSTISMTCVCKKTLRIVYDCSLTNKVSVTSPEVSCFIHISHDP